MTAYLRHRLERAGVESLRRVWILDTHEGWLLQDVSAELATLFPDVSVEMSPLPAPPGCDLALIPYREELQGLRWRRGAVRRVARARPRWVGLYEVGKRRLVVIRRRDVGRWLLRLTSERWIRAARRIASAVGRYLGSVAGRHEVAP